MKKLILIVFLLIGITGMAQQLGTHRIKKKKTWKIDPKQEKQEKQYEYIIEHYQYLKKKSLTKALVGAGLMVSGITLFTIGASNYSMGNESFAIPFLGGLIIFNIGAPLMISGSIATRNNEKAIQIKQKDISLSFGVTNYGLGVVMRF